MAKDWIDDARRGLLGLRQGPGAWGYRPRSAPAAEPTALAGLALLAAGPADDAPGRGPAMAPARWLASAREPDGSLSAVDGLPGPGWPTPLASLLWSASGGFDADRRAAIGWILARKGRTAPRADRGPIGHDTMLVGWPWVAETHSWVEPTAMALLALAAEGMSGHPRALEGVRVLRDRAIPGGGWNLGNPVVFGTALRPLPGPTGLALLALACADGPSAVVGPAIAYLRDALGRTLAPASLGWGTLGLRAWGEVPDRAEGRLASAYDRAASRGAGAVELSLLLLAAGDRTPGVLGIPHRERMACNA